MAKRQSSQRPTPQLFHLDRQAKGETLAGILKQLIPTLSWNQARQAIASRRVQVNGNLCLDPQRRVGSGDVIHLWPESLPRPVGASDIQILYADQHVVVVDKPPGVTSVRHFLERDLPQHRRQLQPTLEELLPEALAKHLDKPRSGRGATAGKVTAGKIIPVHRLDRDTSGLMLFARTTAAAQRLGKMFKQHAIDRRYWALVHGHPSQQTIRSQLVRDRGDGRRGSLAPIQRDPKAQLAITHLRPLATLGPVGWIECQLETGRTHQIRIHLSELGFPLCGDKIYADRRPHASLMTHLPTLNRHALHSATLVFDHPIDAGRPMQFSLDWPNDLRRWIDRIPPNGDQPNHRSTTNDSPAGD
jgi:23S rRNA pseudouridine1911/1915/1917 synthase